MSDKSESQDVGPPGRSSRDTDDHWERVLERLDETDRASDFQWRRHHTQLLGFDEEDAGCEAALDRITSTAPTQDNSLIEREEAKEWREEVWLQGGSLQAPGRPLVRRKKRGATLNDPVTGHHPFRLFSTASGKKVYWDFQFPTSDHLQRFLYVKRILDAGHLSRVNDSERQALLIFRFASHLESERPSKKDLARRFRIKYKRFRRLAAEFDALVERLNDDYREYNHIFCNNPAAYPIDSDHLLIFLVSTGESYLLNHKLDRRQKIERPSPRLKSMFPFLPWR